MLESLSIISEKRSPPPNPLFQRVGFSRKIYDLIRHEFTSRDLGRSKPSERLSSVENIPEFRGLIMVKREAAKGVGNEMSDIGRTGVLEDTGVGYGSYSPSSMLLC